MSDAYDAIVIGSGQAGPFLAARMTAAGLRTALVEREHYGGTCVNDGCMPTKTLVASARAAHVARRAAEFGVTIGGPVGVDMRAVKARKDRVVQQAVRGGGERRGVVHRHRERALAVAAHPSHAAAGYIGVDHGAATGHRLDLHLAERFAPSIAR